MIYAILLGAVVWTVILVWLIMLLIAARRGVEAIEYYISKMTEDVIDNYVERLADRAVRIVEKTFKEDPAKVRLQKPKKSLEKEEAARGIITDVMIANGINPKLYNEKGLIKNSLQKLGI